VVFGGATDFESKGVLKSKICLRNIWTFDLEERKWSEVEVEGPDLAGRQNMALCLHEGSIYLHGGCKMFKQVCDEFYKFDLSTRRWSELKVVGKNLALSHHTLTPYTLPNGRIVFLLFGGVDKDNFPQNRLLLLSFKTESILKAMELPNHSKLQPLARFNHSCELYQNRYLLVYAGRNDFLFGVGAQKGEIAVNDLIAYDLFELRWNYFFAYGYHPPARWAAGFLLYKNEKG